MIISDCLLESITSFLKRMQESHKELMAGKCVLLIAGDAVERCNPICVTEPYGVITFFHRQPPLLNYSQGHSLCSQIHFVVVSSLEVNKSVPLICHFCCGKSHFIDKFPVLE